MPISRSFDTNSFAKKVEMMNQVANLLPPFVRNINFSSEPIQEQCVPKVDVWDNADGIKIRAFLPGITLDNVRVEIQNGKLSITAKTNDVDRSIKNQVYQRKYSLEYFAGIISRLHQLGKSYNFWRVFALPVDADTCNIKTTFVDNVLDLKIQRISAH
jgi:HSP20 family molecular chaperone IbpA